MRRVKGQERRVESQRRTVALRSHSGSRLSTLDSRPSRTGVTLVELLITILIISILAGLILGMASLAGEKAREAQTRHVVQRLHQLLMEHYATYKTRRVKLTRVVEIEISIKFPNEPAKRGMATAEARLYALREMMLMEIPDRWSDVLLDDIGSAAPNSTELATLYLLGRTDLSNVYLRRYKSLIGRTNTVTNTANTAADIKANQSAECLYMVITLATGDGEARSLFGESSIGDTDGDGAPEFLDGWGHPIQFLRWAPGFDSQIQINANQFSNDRPLKSGDNPTWESQAAADHEPFDVYRADVGAFRLVPLVFSAGRDEEYGIYDGSNYDPIWRPNSSVSFKVNNQFPYISPPLDPYDKPGGSIVVGSNDGYIGTGLHLINSTKYENTSTDNIHNHLLGQR